jgi:hypothetical protein
MASSSGVTEVTQGESATPFWNRKRDSGLTSFGTQMAISALRPVDGAQFGVLGCDGDTLGGDGAPARAQAPPSHVALPATPQQLELVLRASTMEQVAMLGDAVVRGPKGARDSGCWGAGLKEHWCARAAGLQGCRSA